MAMPFRILQINTNHSFSATEHLKINLDQIQAPVIAIQEPYYFKNKVIGFAITDVIVQHTEKPRTAIVIRDKSIDIFARDII